MVGGLCIRACRDTRSGASFTKGFGSTQTGGQTTTKKQEPSLRKAWVETKEREAPRGWRTYARGQKGCSQSEAGGSPCEAHGKQKQKAQGQRGRLQGTHRSPIFGIWQFRLCSGRLPTNWNRSGRHSSSEDEAGSTPSSERGRRPTGYKRHIYKRLSRTAGPQSHCCRQSREREQAEEEEENPSGTIGGSVSQDPYSEGWEETPQEAWEVRQRSPEREEEEEEIERQEEEEVSPGRGPVEFRRDRQLRQELRRLFGELGRPRVERIPRLRGPDAEEDTRETGQCVGTAGSTCKRAIGSVQHCGGAVRRDEIGRGSEGVILLPDPGQATVGNNNSCGERDVSPSNGDRFVAEGAALPSGGFHGSKVFRTTSIDPRRRLGSCETSRNTQPGRHDSHQSSRPPTNSQAREDGCKGSGVGTPGSLEQARRTWTWWKGKRQVARRMEREPERREERKRKREESALGRQSLGRRKERIRLDHHKGGPSRKVKRQVSPGGLTRGRAHSDRSVTRLGGLDFFKDETDRVFTFGRILSQCDGLARTGCALCWTLVHAVFNPKGANFEAGMVQAILATAAKAKTPLKRKKGEVFPMREGELSRMRMEMLQTNFEKATSDVMVEKFYRDAWLYLLLFAGNRLAGHEAVAQTGPWTKAEQAAVGSMRAAIQRRCQNDKRDTVDMERIEKDVTDKQVSYSGEEISTCQKLTLDQVLPSLPPMGHGGSIDSLAWVGPTTRRFLENPEHCVLEQPNLTGVSIPGKIHVTPEDKLPLALELVRRGVCEWYPLEDVFEVGNRRLLNGLFGVKKPTQLGDGRPVLRLIMNLVPSNRVLQQLMGRVNSLPSIMSWSSIVLEDGQALECFQSYMSSAFYLFSLPRSWRRFLAFNIVVDGEDIGRPSKSKWALTCSVIPMGWSSSVGLMQEISENILLGGGILRSHQISREKLLPRWLVETVAESKQTGAYWWHIYLDNFCAAEKLIPPDPSLRGSRCHELAEHLWRDSGVISSEKKRKVAQRQIEELGAEIDGDLQAIGGSNQRFLKVMQATLWILSQRYMNRKHLQIIAGRWIFLMQFRRPTMGIFNDIWGMISGNLKKSRGSVQEVRRELFMAMCIVPLMHTFLGARVGNFISASDASSYGGAVAISHELTQQGKDFTAACKLAEDSPGLAPILVISLFNGIGGAFRCYDLIGITPMGRISFDISKEANRTTNRRWPGTLMYEDIRSISPQMVNEWAHKFGGISEVHLWGGFPCVDLSSAKAYRLNLDGPQSSLFWEIPRILQLLKAEFKGIVAIKHCFENVASMDASATIAISDALQCTPYRVNCVDAVPMNRPRFAWVSEELDGVLEGISLDPQKLWTEVRAPASYPQTGQWIQPLHRWLGEDDQIAFPTCMKSIPREHPPPKPAGLQKCDENCIARWKADKFRYPPYQYKEKYLIVTDSTWRLLSASEREILLGYGYGHTLPCMSASTIKQNKQRYEDARCSLLGDSFSIYSFIIFAYLLSVRFLPRIHYTLLADRMGLAPGFRAPIRLKAQLGRTLQYGAPNKLFEGMCVQDLNKELLKRTDHTGSDIRIVSGEVLNKKIFPRQSVSASWWTWKHTFKLKWQRPSHINLLELEAIILAMKFHAVHSLTTDSRVFHISDSYICISICSKGRSGSRMLQRRLRHLSAYLLAFGIQLVAAHVESTENPTDEASRS